MDIMYLPTLYSACQCIIMYICCTSLKLRPALKLLQVGCLQYSRLKRYLACEATNCWYQQTTANFLCCHQVGCENSCPKASPWLRLKKDVFWIRIHLAFACYIIWLNILLAFPNFAACPPAGHSLAQGVFWKSSPAAVSRRIGITTQLLFKKFLEPVPYCDESKITGCSVWIFPDCAKK